MIYVNQTDEQLAGMLGAACKAARTRAGITQVTAATRASITPEFYGNLERGKKLPRLPTLMRIAAALDTHPGQLLGDKHMLEPLPAAPMLAEAESKMLRAFTALPIPMRGIATQLVKQLALLFPGVDDDELVEDLDWMAGQAKNSGTKTMSYDEGVEHRQKVNRIHHRLLANSCRRSS